MKYRSRVQASAWQYLRGSDQKVTIHTELTAQRGKITEESA
jgi:hypothetical protein